MTYHTQMVTIIPMSRVESLPTLAVPLYRLIASTVVIVLMCVILLYTR